MLSSIKFVDKASTDDALRKEAREEKARKKLSKKQKKVWHAC